MAFVPERRRIINDALRFVGDFDVELRTDLAAVSGLWNYAHLEAILEGGWLAKDLVNVPAGVLDALEHEGFVDSLEGALIKPSDAARVLSAFDRDRELTRSIFDAFDSYGDRFLSDFTTYESIHAFRDSSQSRPDTLEVADGDAYRTVELLGGVEKTQGGLRVTPAGRIATRAAYILMYL